MYSVHVQNTGSVRVNPGHVSLASRVGSGLGSLSLTRFRLWPAPPIRRVTLDLDAL